MTSANGVRPSTNVWPGDRKGRRAVIGDWLDLPVESGSVDVVLGDGCLAVVGSSAIQRGLFAEVARVLKNDGRGAIRTFASPQSPDPLDEVRALAMTGRVSSFHELKWRVAFARAFHHPERVASVRAIRDAFNETFPNRMELAAATGWSQPVIDTIDLYEKSDAIYIFALAEIWPTRHANSSATSASPPAAAIPSPAMPPDRIQETAAPVILA